MNTANRKYTIASAVVFLIAAIVYVLSAERTGSLWDCGEFILAAHKLQVVHPPGAPLFLLVGRLFAFLGDIFSADPSNIAFAVNIMSGLFSAGAAALVGHGTMLLSEKYFDEPDETATWLSAAAGVVAGLATAFSTSIWFSAVEGEVYAMSTFFTALTAWAVIKWYCLPDTPKHDKWLIFAAYSAGLSIGVHLLSLLTFPALALFVYFKKAKSFNLLHALMSAGIGVVTVPFIQKFIIVGIPTLWKSMDLMMVNSFGLPINSGIVVTLILLAAVFVGLLYYAKKKSSYILQLATVATIMITIGYSMIGVVVIRANADTPVNMNVPSDPSRLLPYLNREQYGERALVYGPAYDASPKSYDREARKGIVDFPPYYDAVDDLKYEDVDEKITPVYDSADKMFFPRISHAEMGRPNIYKTWHEMTFGGNPKPSFGFNLFFFLKYQIGWMYTRYFMWNFVGKQNGSQGYYSWDKSDGNWKSGVKFIDEQRLYNMDALPTTFKENEANNSYYFLPLIFGLIGLFFHAFKRPQEFAGLFMLFLITGIGIIIYTNQPPNEPRERDYVLVGSFFTFCMWIGMAVPAIYRALADKVSIKGMGGIGIASALVLSAPIIMGFQNFDDHSRNGQYGARDYAKNFLNSLDPNAIIFTYGDNDTYPLWYAQEVENVRRDVRIVNLSLITVDWYINKLRRKVNDAPGINLTIPPSAYRGNKRNQLPIVDANKGVMRMTDALKFMGGNNPIGQQYTFESYLPGRQFIIPANAQAAQRLGVYNPADTTQVLTDIRLSFGESKAWLTKDELAILDVIASNINERPVYFATTCQNSKLLGLNDYMSFEGLALRVVPFKNPSDRTMSIYGSGRVDTERAHKNMTEKWVWGNFDKEKMFVNDSYGAAIQAHRLTMQRAAETLMKEGKPQKAIDIVDKYLEGFPHFNFPYDAGTVPFINVYVQTQQFDKAKEHIRILAKETQEFLAFYDSIDPEVKATSFAQDAPRRQNAMLNIFNMVNRIGDQELIAEIEQLLGAYRAQNIPN